MKKGVSILKPHNTISDNGIYEPIYEDGGKMEKGGDVANITFMKWVTEYNVNNKDEILAFFSLPSKYINPSLLSENNNNVILDVFEKQKDDIDAKKHFQKILDKADELGVTIYLEPIPRVHKLKSREHKQKITKDYLTKYYNNFGFTKDKNGFMVRHPKMEKGGLLAPNGKKSNLTPEQYKLVRTREFKAWFGDWENDHQNASKVVDENGEPLVVYHGTYAKDKFNVFDFNKADLGFHFGTYEQAKDRSETKIGIKDFKQFIEPFFLNIRTLFVINDAIEFEYPQSYINDLFKRNIITEQEINENGLKGFTIKQSNEIIRNLLVEKYNKVGFKYENKIEGEGYSYIVCEPNQIKLADGSNTTFNNRNPDIRYKNGGFMEKGGELNPDDPKLKNTMIHKSGSAGGVLVGKRHSEGGIKAINKSSNSPLEMEGGEVVITRNAVSDNQKREFEGQMMTNREILSKINEEGGGVAFADGGKVEKEPDCGCDDTMEEGGDTNSKIYKGFEIGSDGTYKIPNIKNFGIKHHDLPPSEAFKKLYSHKFEDGGEIYKDGGLIQIIDKQIPSMEAFENAFKHVNFHSVKNAYKQHLKKMYNVTFTELPHRIQMALLLGNQKLVDKFINE